MKSHSSSEKGSILFVVVVVMAVGAATVMLLPRIASQMSTSYRRLTVESAYKVTTENLKLSLRNPGWIRCLQLHECALRKVDQLDPASPSFVLRHTQNTLARLEERLGCNAGPVQKCKATLVQAPKLNQVDLAKGKTRPYLSLEIRLDDNEINLSPVLIEVDMPRGVALAGTNRFLCDGYFLGYQANGDPICKNLTGRRSEIGRYIAEFDPRYIDDPDRSLEELAVPEYVRDCALPGSNLFLMSYEWERGQTYKYKCGNRLPPWQVN